MAHDVIYCDFCGRPVMESRADWLCDCGAYCGPSSGYKWVKSKPEEIEESE